MSLLPDDACRVCFHGPHAIPCVEISVDPGPPPDCEPMKYVCGCPEYVDLQAESRIIVTLDSPDERHHQAGAPEPHPQR